MRKLSGKDVCRILMEHGFETVRQRGSYVIMQKSDGSKTTTVPVPNHKELKEGTLRSIVRQSGLSKSLFD